MEPPKRAAVPVPSAKPGWVGPPPARVVTTVAYDDYFTANTGQPAPAGALHISGSLQNGTIAVNGAGVLFFPLGCAIEKAGP